MAFLDQAYPPHREDEFQHIGGVLRHFKNIRTFIFDVDGVLTNNEVLITEAGELLRTMNARDGFAMKHALREGYQILILTGGKSKGVIERLRGLGIRDIIAGCDNKLEEYVDFVAAYALDESQILYLGDDLPDLEVMQRVGFSCCPKDAAHEILEIAQYISPFDGGKGCVRDVIEKVLRLQGKWF